MSTLRDYTLFFKRKFDSIDALKAATDYDLLISSYNDSERVKKVFESINAKDKHWLIMPEYRYAENEYPVDEGRKFVFSGNESESRIIRSYFQESGLSISSTRICVDITGFIRPHLVFLVQFLASQKAKAVDFIYSDPVRYAKKEETSFSDDYHSIRPIEGCLGTHDTDTSNDLLIIGAGYDSDRINDIAKSKADARKVQMFGFPSLQPDMYQENILRAYQAEEYSSNGRSDFIDGANTLFAPANDPFVTANVLSEFIHRGFKENKISNLYLSPLSTKAQTLGFALFYVAEGHGKPVSMVFPFCRGYSRETTEGIAKIWKYTVEFDSLIA